MKYFLFLLLIPLNSQAFFQKLYQGFKKSDSLKEVLLDEKIHAADYKFNENRYDWNLNLNAQAQDSFLQALFAFQSQQTITQSYSLGVSKSSYKFGTFSLSHNQVSYDLSNWSDQSLSSFSFVSQSPYGYSFRQGRGPELFFYCKHFPK